jgi:hypothetical protein
MASVVTAFLREAARDAIPFLANPLTFFLKEQD